MESYAIITIQNNGFVYAQGKRPRVAGLAHKTLEAIDTILSNNLPCLSGNAPDLHALAANIQTRYLSKTRKLSWIRRFFGRVTQKERTLQALVTRLPTTTLITALPAELVQHICSFIALPWDLARLSRVSRLFREAVGAVRSQVLLPLAREWGCRTDDPIAHLQALFQEFRSHPIFWERDLGIPFVWRPGLLRPILVIEPIFTHLRTRRDALSKETLLNEVRLRVRLRRPTAEDVSRVRLLTSIAYAQKLASAEEIVSEGFVLGSRLTNLSYYQLALELLPEVDTPFLRLSDVRRHIYYTRPDPGWTLLAVACANCADTTVVDFLIERGASLSARVGLWGNTPEQLASLYGHSQLAAHIRAKRLAQGGAP